MKTHVQKSELVAVVTENRDNHRGLFEEALESYKVRAQKELDKSLARIKAGDPVKVYIVMTPPEDHTNDYDRALKMLSLETRDIIDLDEHDAAQYLMDDWGWTDSFAGAYTSNTGKSYYSSRR